MNMKDNCALLHGRQMSLTMGQSKAERGMAIRKPTLAPQNRAKAVCLALGAAYVFVLVYQQSQEEINDTRRSGTYRHLEEDVDELFKLSNIGGKEIGGFLIAILGLAIAAAGGIGGGAILVPVLVLMFGFPTKYASSLSNTCIFGGAIANFAFNVRRRHPSADRPLIDFNIAVIMIPMAMGGAILGTVLAKLLPNYILSLMLVLLLAVTSVRTLRKGVEKYKSESAQSQRFQVLQEDNNDAEEQASGDGGAIVEVATSMSQVEEGSRHKQPYSLHTSPSSVEGAENPKEGKALSPELAEDTGIYTATEKQSNILPSGFSSVKSAARLPTFPNNMGKASKASNEDGTIDADFTSKPSAQTLVPSSAMNSSTSPGVPGSTTNVGEQLRRHELAAILAEEKQLPWKKLVIIFTCYMGILVSSIAGSLATPCGSVAYWILLAIELPWVVLFAAFAGRILNREYKEKLAAGYEFLQGDVQWDVKKIVRFPAICLLAGLVAGLFGIGGGVIMSPLMLEMGVRPEVTAATSAFMIFYTSASAVIKFIAFGLMPLEYSALMFTMGLVVTLLAQVFVTRLVKKSGRESIVILLIASGIGLGCLLMAYSAVDKTIKNYNAPFQVSICS